MRKVPVIAFLLGATVAAQADVTLAPVFSDHAVLQRDKPLPIWGTADPGESISVKFKEQTVQATAGEDGRWKVQLAPLPASKEPAELIVTGKTVVKVEDLLVGEVWFCAGQSNMAFSVSKVDNAAEEIRTADYPLIRGYRMARKISDVPLNTASGNWQVVTPAIAGNLSAVSFFFGRALYQRLDVPIGLITASWGGTRIESWINPESLAADPLGPSVAERWKKALADFPELKTKYDADLKKWQAAADAAKAAGKTFTKREPRAPEGPGHYNTPSGLFNGLVHPVVPYAIRGILWYQGESNTARPDEYADLMLALVKGWRGQFAQGDLPFYWVQLPKFGSTQNTDWAQLREAQSKATSLPATGQVVTIDIDLSDPKNKHPTNKQEVSRRLVRLAAGELYGAKEDYLSPRFAALKPDGAALRLSFSHPGGTLKSTTAPLTGFEVAGEDHVFHPAEAVIEGEEVVVKSPEVAKPIAARYAFHNFPQAALFGGNGLPVEPFRTDDWAFPKPTPAPAAAVAD